MVKETDALGAFVGHDVIDIFGQGRTHLTIRFINLAAFVDRVVRTSRQARPTIDTFFRNDGSHFCDSRAARSQLRQKTSPQTPSITDAFLQITGFENCETVNLAA